MGEIPPYAFSYHAARAGIRNEEWDSIFAVRPAAEGQGLLEASINRMKAWMLGFIQRCARGTGRCSAGEPRSRAAGDGENCRRPNRPGAASGQSVRVAGLVGGAVPVLNRSLCWW